MMLTNFLKSHDYSNRCRKSIWRYLESIPKTNCQQIKRVKDIFLSVIKRYFQKSYRASQVALVVNV